jgi:hypothetical protein
MICIYPPGYYAALKMLGSSIAVGRLVSTVAVFVIACLLAVAVGPRLRTASRLLVAFFFLSVFPAMAWNHGSLVKPEFLAVCFSFSGFVVYLRRGLESSRGLWIPYTGVLCGVALLTKPTAFPVFAAICLHLLCRKRFREMLRFAAATVVLPVSVYGILFIRTNGGIWVMTIVGNALHLDIGKILQVAMQEYMLYGFVGLGVGACAVFLIEGINQARIVTALYFLISVSWFGVAVGRPGSSHSYFLDAAVSGSLVIGMAILRAVEERGWMPMSFLIAAALPSMFAGVPGGLSELRSFSNNDRKEHIKVLEHLSRLETKPDEYVLSDAFSHADVVEAGLHPVVNDSFQYTLMVKNHIISTAPLIRLLEQRRLPYAVLQNTIDWHSIGDYWPVDVVNYLENDYMCTRIMERKGGNYLVIYRLR